MVRLYKNYDGSDQEQAILVSSWRALKDMEKSNSRQSGLVSDWHQARGLLFTGGDARVIKVWDVHQEMPVMVKSSLIYFCFVFAMHCNTCTLFHRIFPLNLLVVSPVLQVIKSMEISSLLVLVMDLSVSMIVVSVQKKRKSLFKILLALANNSFL